MKKMGGEVSLYNPDAKKFAYVGAVLSDIHNGAFDAKQWYMELEEGFLKHIEKLSVLDFVVLDGDFFHTKVSANSDHAKFALKFLTRLLKICGKKNAKLRIIKGTESHDNRQLELFDGMDSVAECDFKIFHTVADEWLFEDLHVLYVPEEYMEDMDEYYKDYMGEDAQYDYVFGHGVVDKAAFLAVTQESEETRSQAPIFKVAKLHEICKGPIYFGHIHKPFLLDRFRYVGSYSRWAFGEEEDKGFIMTYYTPVTSEYKDEFIINENVRTFNTVKIEYTSTVFNKPEMEQINYLMDIADNLKSDYLRFEINIPETYPNPMLLTNMLKEAFHKHSRVKLKINNNSKLRQKQETEDKINKLMDQFSFIFAKSTSIEEKVSVFVKLQYGRNIPVDKMRYYLFEDIISSKGETSKT
jgi:DNA repair exonuclease SbcCD nuclease subunit